MFSRRRGRIRLRTLDLKEVRSLPALPSGYRTDRIFALTRGENHEGLVWTLQERCLDAPVEKVYDNGEGGAWIETYQDAGPAESLRFLGAGQGNDIDAVATWTIRDWNRSLWLVDIRVRSGVRGQGLGSALVDRLGTICRQEHLRGITVETQNRNFGAVRFYLRRGFRITGFDDHLYSDNDLARQDVALFLFLEVE